MINKIENERKKYKYLSKIKDMILSSEGIRY